MKGLTNVKRRFHNMPPVRPVKSSNSPKSENPPELTVNDFISDEEISNKFTITPEIAQILIEEGTNSLNRPVSDSTVDEYGEQMKKGKWRLNGEAIIISKDGLLLDGQHRLWASFKTKKSFKTMVTRGVDKETFATIDTGKKRTGSDALIIHGKITGLPLKYTTNLSAAATICIEISRGTLLKRSSRAAKITRQDIIDFVEKNRELSVWIDRSRTKKTWATGYSAGVAAICFIASKNGFEMKAMDFMHKFMTGENLDGRSPVMALRNRLGTEKRMMKAERLALMIHALNKFIDNEQLTVLKLPKGEMPIIHEKLSVIGKKPKGGKVAVQSKLASVD
jgi:hypothetical protein